MRTQGSLALVVTIICCVNSARLLIADLFLCSYGAMHPEIAQCLRMLARLNYIMGDHAEALAFQQKAVLMSERVNGIDHPYTITEYTHLALYCFANSQIRYFKVF